MRFHIASLVLSSVLFSCFACCGGQSGEVLVVGYTNGAPVTKVGTNDYYRDKLSHGLDKKTLDVKLDSPKDWRKSYEQFSSVLVKEAKTAGLDADSLEKLLKRLIRAKENKELALIPVAAHQTQDGGEPLWIITFKWEEEKAVLEGSMMAHIRYFWFHRRSLKQIDFLTCG
ncbi:MAG: hypothetical protein QM813_00325 [Verrucomicrobiota bacterium]